MGGAILAIPTLGRFGGLIVAIIPIARSMSALACLRQLASLVYMGLRRAVSELTFRN